MSVRNNSQIKKTISPTSIGDTYKLVRSDVYYFLQFVNYQNELFNTPSALTSKPNVIFYTENAVNKIIIDYSFANETDKTYLKLFFTSMNQTQGISLNTGSYLEENKGIAADITSSLSFNEFKNNYIFATVNNTINKNSATDVYRGEYFINTPQLYSTVGLGQDESSKIVGLVCPNIGGKYLYSLGLASGDIIEIINSNSENTTKRFKISDYLVLNDKEIVLFEDSELISENLTGSPSIVNLFIEPLGTNTNSVKLNLTDTIYGLCAVSSGIVLKNSTKYQCQLRRGNWVKS